MQPNQPEQTEATVVTPPTTKTHSLKLPIIMLLWPVAIPTLAVLGYALANATLGESGLLSIINICLYIIGILTILLGPVSFVAGIILLVIALQRRR